jgi:hypothetical protein
MFSLDESFWTNIKIPCIRKAELAVPYWDSMDSILGYRRDSSSDKHLCWRLTPT